MRPNFLFVMIFAFNLAVASDFFWRRNEGIESSYMRKVLYSVVALLDKKSKEDKAVKMKKDETLAIGVYHPDLFTADFNEESRRMVWADRNEETDDE